MKRLTLRDEKGRAYFLLDGRKVSGAVAERLARYEDTGLEQGEIQELSNSIAVLGHANAELRDAIPEWISVKERLPKAFVSVLVYVPELAPLPTVNEGYVDKHGIFHGVRLGLNEVKATHWMPLPEPPERGGAEE